MNCELLSTLYWLRKSSMEAIEDTDSFSVFKGYLHVKRPVEYKLKKLLKRINESNNKTLVLLCGSAGDGKSHLISYLKHIDPEQLLDGYELYNDATASDAPTLTSAETLAERLFAFSDGEIEKQDNTKMIIAINLGTLNNFIDSQVGANYSKLREYVLSNEILTSTSASEDFFENSPFQHVSFSDYQVFSLVRDGIDTSYMKELLDKVFSENDANPFEKAHKACENCSLRKHCPVKHNYEFIRDKRIQKTIVERVIETVIKDKVIVSTREFLNLVFDIIVHPEFDKAKFLNFLTNSVDFIQTYIMYSTPMLLNEYSDISLLIDSIRTHDVLKKRDERLDNSAIHFHTLDSITEDFSQIMLGTPYESVIETEGFALLGAIKPELRRLLFCFITRLNDMYFSEEKPRYSLMKKYVEYLYYAYSGNIRGLNELYRITKNAIYNWDRKSDGESICIDDLNDNYWISEKLQIKAAPLGNRVPPLEKVDQFYPSISMRFEKADGTSYGSIIGMDYSLFKMIYAMNEGYRPTYQEKIIHTDFEGFIRELIDLGSKTKEVFIISKTEDNKERFIFEENEFGFEFRRLQS